MAYYFKWYGITLITAIFILVYYQATFTLYAIIKIIAIHHVIDINIYGFIFW